MATLNEDYVSKETAKLMKDKRFDGECRAYYKPSDNDLHIAPTPLKYKILLDETLVLAPTLQIAMKWLREVYNIHIIAEPCLDEGNELNLSFNRWFWTILKEGEYKPIRNIDEFSTYEQACKEAILYCLKNLI